MDQQAAVLLEQVEQFLSKTNSLKQHSAAHLSHQELLIASGMILLSLAYLDLDFSDAEQKTLLESFVKRCSVTPELAQEYLESAEVARIRLQSMDGLLEEMRNNLSVTERQQLYTACWEVILADRKIQHFELKAATELGKKLGLSTEEELNARNNSSI